MKQTPCRAARLGDLLQSSLERRMWFLGCLDSRCRIFQARPQVRTGPFELKSMCAPHKQIGYI